MFGMKTIRCLLQITILMLLACQTLWAGQPGDAQIKLPTLTPKSTLSDYLAYAALNNPELESAFYRWKAELAAMPREEALPDPMVSYGYYIREVETRVGPQRHRFGISQMFPWFGKRRLKGEIAMQAAMVAFQNYEQKKLELFYRVKTAWQEYYYLGRAIDIMRENIRLLSDMEASMRSRYKLGERSHSDIIRLHVEQDKLNDRLEALEELKVPLRAELNAALNRPVNEYVPEIKSLSPSDLELLFEELAAQLEQHSPRIQALEEEKTKAALSLKLARKKYFPDITLGVSYIQTDDAIVEGVEDSGKDPVIGTLALNLPIWFDKNKSSVSSASHRLKAVSKAREDVTNNLVSQLKMAFYRYEDARRKVRLYTDSLIPTARESLKVLQMDYSAAASDFSAMIDAQRLLLELEFSFERALTDSARYLAQISRLTGVEIENDHTEK